MTQIDMIPTLPRSVFSEIGERAAKEFRAWGNLSFGNASMSTHIWRVSIDDKLVLYAGLLPKSILARRQEVWLLLGKDFSQNLRANVKLLEVLYDEFLRGKELKAKVTGDAGPAIRFAQHFGFRVVRHLDNVYEMEN